jgi:uncharacterized OB-fold protein
MIDTPLTPPVPAPDPDTAGYWEALNGGKLAICRCADCRTWMHPPLETCRHCCGETRFEAVSGQGTVYSFIVVRRQSVPGFVPPYVVGVVEIVEQPGVRLTGVIEADPTEVAIGQPVRAVIRSIAGSHYSAPAWQLMA